jgi:uncharacterized membrane protein
VVWRAMESFTNDTPMTPDAAYSTYESAAGVTPISPAEPTAGAGTEGQDESQV